MTAKKRAVARDPQPKGKTKASGFEAGNVYTTRLRNFNPSNTEVNDLIVGDGNVMRARSRKLVQENPWAGGALDAVVANTIGTGIRPHSLHPDKAMRAKIVKAWKRCVPTLDASGKGDFYALQTLVCRAIRTDGEVFIRTRYRRPADKIPFDFQLQILEADYCPLERNALATGDNPLYTRAGIQMDPLGKPRGYWMYKTHPGSTVGGFKELNLIPADLILHMFEVKRPGQLRGYPWLTPAIVTLYDIKQLLDASLMRVKVSNLLSVFIRRQPGTTTGVLAGEKAKTGLDGKTPVPGVAESQLQPGTVTYLNAGEEVEQVTPNADGADLKEFFNVMLRAVARALGVTFEQLSGDLSDVNYSSIRAGLLEFRRWCEAWQYNVIIFQFCRQVWRIFIEQAIILGEFGEGAKKDYDENPENWDARWDPPGWPWVDPLKDGMAARGSIRDGLSSRQFEAAAVGFDSEELDEQQRQDNARADEAGLTYDSDARKKEGDGNPEAQAQLDKETQIAVQEAKPTPAKQGAKKK